MKPRASALDHLKRYPNARPSTIIAKARQEAMNDRLRREIEMRRAARSPLFGWIAKARRWPAYVWRW